MDFQLVATVPGTLNLPEVNILVPRYAGTLQPLAGRHVFTRAAPVEASVVMPNVAAALADLAQLTI